MRSVPYLLVRCLGATALATTALYGVALPRAQAATRIAIRHGQWYLDGRVTYPGAKAEGLLLNDLNQRFPFEFRGAADSPIIYRRIQNLTRSQSSHRTERR